MRNMRQAARINVKFLVILGLIIGLLGVTGAVGYKVRKRIIANRALAAGKAALAREDWPEACKHLKQYLNKYPNDEEMLESYAEANLSIRPTETDHLGAALGAYRMLLRNNPGDDRISEKLAKLYIRAFKFNEAAYVCQKRLDVDPNDADAALLLSKALLAQRKFDEASEILKQLTDKHPQEAETYVLLSAVVWQDESPEMKKVAMDLLNPDGEKDLKTGPDLALGLLDLGITKCPQSALLLGQRARFHRVVQGDTKAQRVDLEAADALTPTDPGVLLLLINEWIEHPDLERAKTDLEAIERLDEATLASYDFGFYDLELPKLKIAAVLCLRSGDGAEAVALADRALKELPDTRRSGFLLHAFELYMFGGQIDKAKRMVEEHREAVKERIVNEPLFKEQLAMLDARLASVANEAHKVINLLEPIISDKHGDRRAWRLLAWAYEATGQNRRSLPVLAEYNARWPNDSEITTLLAKAYIRQGLWSDALKYARLAEKLLPENPEPKVLRVKAMINAMLAGQADSESKDQLLKELADLRKELPKDLDIRILAARLAVHEQRLEEAVAELEKAVAQCAQALPAAMLLVDLHNSNANKDKAIEVCKAATKKYPESAIPRLTLADLQMSADSKDEARKTLDQAVTDLTGEEQAKAKRASALYLLMTDDRPAGIDLLKKLAVEQPGDTQARMALLQMKEIQNDPQEAQKYVDELKSIEGPIGLLWRFEQVKLWGRIAQAQAPGEQRKELEKREEEIRDMLTHCINNDAKWVDPVVMLGTVYEVIGKVDEAEKTYRQALRVLGSDTRSAFVANKLLDLLESQGRFTEANEVLKSVSEKNRQLPGMSKHIVGVALGTGDYDQAKKELEERVAADPKDASAKVLLAMVVHARDKDANRALKLLDEALAASPDTISIVSTKASILQAEGRSDEALALLNAEVNRRNDFAAYLLRADHYADAGQLELAEKDYRHLTTFKDSSAEGYGALGRFYHKSGKIDQAIAAWESGLKADPDSTLLKRLLAITLATSEQPNDRKRGQELVDRLLQQFPDDTALLAAQARALLADRTPEAEKKAAAIFERVVKLNPNDVAAHLYLIDQARRQGDLETASTLVTQAMGDNPQNIQLLLARASVEFDLNNMLTARESAQSAYRIDPENIAALLLLANTSCKLGDLSSAEDYVKQAETQEPDNPLVFAARTRLLAAQNRHEEILNLFEARRKNHPNEPHSLVAVASCLAGAKEEKYIQQAKRLFEELVALNPDGVEGYIGLGQVMYRLGEIEAAAKAWRRILELDPFHQDALNNLAWTLSEDMQKPTEALELANQSVSRYPNDPHILNTRGVIFYRLGMLNKACEDLERCLVLTANIPSTRAKTLLFLGRIEIQQGKLTQAKARLTEAKEIDSRHNVLSPEERAEIEQLMVSGL